MKMLLAWYSATGNTRRLAGALAEGLREAGHEVDLADMLRDEVDGVELEGYDRVGFAFPVMIFRVPNAVADFIDKLPVQNSQKQGFALISHGGGPARTDAILLEMLRKKNVSLTHCKEILCSDSYIPFRKWLKPFGKPGLPNEESLGTARGYAREITGEAGKVAWRPRGGLDRWFLHLFVAKIAPPDAGKSFFGKRHTDNGLCNGCGLCVKVCPTGAVTLAGGKAVTETGKCIGCCACFNNCPEEALRLKRFGVEYFYKGFKPVSMTKNLP